MSPSEELSSPVEETSGDTTAAPPSITPASRTEPDLEEEEEAEAASPAQVPYSTFFQGFFLGHRNFVRDAPDAIVAG
jgi:hypothetical protein